MWVKSARRRQTGSAAAVTYTAGLYYIVCAAASNRYLIILVVLIPVRAQQNVVWSRQRTVDFWQTLQLSLSQVWHWAETRDDIKPLTARLYMINPLFNENYYILLLHINYHNSLSHTHSSAFTVIVLLLYYVIHEWFTKKRYAQILNTAEVTPLSTPILCVLT